MYWEGLNLWITQLNTYNTYLPIYTSENCFVVNAVMAAVLTRSQGRTRVISGVRGRVRVAAAASGESQDRVRVAGEGGSQTTW